MLQNDNGNERIRVSIIDQVRGTKTQVVLPSNARVSRLVPALVQQMGLPLDREGGGGRQEYYLVRENQQGGQGERLQEDQTLAQAGIGEGAVLRILPQMTAGC